VGEWEKGRRGEGESGRRGEEQTRRGRADKRRQSALPSGYDMWFLEFKACLVMEGDKQSKL